MKKLNITHVSLMVNIETPIKVGTNGAIEVTLVHQAFISRDKEGKISCDIDFMNIENQKFLGIEIKDGYIGWNKFKTTMLELGIDVDKLIDEKETELLKETNMKEQLKFEFMDKI